MSYAVVTPTAQAQEVATITTDCETMVALFSLLAQRNAMILDIENLRLQRNAAAASGDFAVAAQLGHRRKILEQQPLPLSEEDYLTLRDRHAALVRRLLDLCQCLFEKEDDNTLAVVSELKRRIESLDLSTLPPSGSHDPVLLNPSAPPPFKTEHEGAACSSAVESKESGTDCGAGTEESVSNATHTADGVERHSADASGSLAAPAVVQERTMIEFITDRSLETEQINDCVHQSTTSHVQDNLIELVEASRAVVEQLSGEDAVLTTTRGALPDGVDYVAQERHDSQGSPSDTASQQEGDMTPSAVPAAAADAFTRQKVAPSVSNQETGVPNGKGRGGDVDKNNKGKCLIA